MIDRFDLATDAALEAALIDLGESLDWPATPDLAPVIGSRLRSGPPVSFSDRRSDRSRTVRRALLLAAALVLVAAGAVAAVRLGLDLLRIDIGPVPSASSAPSASSTPSAPGRSPIPPASRAYLGLGLGRSATLEQARSSVDFALRVPAELGDPARVFIGGPVLRGQVAFLYDAGPELPASDLLDGAGLLVTQARGEPDEGLANKLVDAGLATIESVTVGGAPGYWISGEPHVFWYLAPDGKAIEDGRRLVGDTLVWERDGILYRIEGAISRERAIEIAESMT